MTLIDYYLSFKLFLKINRLINESNVLSFAWFGIYLSGKIFCKNKIYVNNKLTKSFKINFDIWYSNVIEFYNFLVLIKLIF